MKKKRERLTRRNNISPERKKREKKSNETNTAEKRKENTIRR